GLKNVEELEAEWLADLRRQRRHEPVETPPVLPPTLAVRSEPPAAEKPRLPAAAPAPVTWLASLSADGLYLSVRRPGVSYRLHNKRIKEDGQEREVFWYEPVSSDVAESFPVSGVQAFDTNGQRLDAKALTKMLAKETAVLVSADGQKVDPFHLQV